MNKKYKHAISLMMLAAAILLSAPIARADALSVAITSPVVVKPGDEVTISALLTNISGSTLYLNTAGETVTGPFTFDDSPFYDNTPFPFSLAAGGSINIDILKLTVDPGANLGLYSQFFTVYGGTDEFASDALNTTTGAFDVNVVPEPASMMLLGTGLTAVVGAVRRRRRS